MTRLDGGRPAAPSTGARRGSGQTAWPHRGGRAVGPSRSVTDRLAEAPFAGAARRRSALLSAPSIRVAIAAALGRHPLPEPDRYRRCERRRPQLRRRGAGGTSPCASKSQVLRNSPGAARPLAKSIFLSAFREVGSRSHGPAAVDEHRAVTTDGLSKYIVEVGHRADHALQQTDFGAGSSWAAGWRRAGLTAGCRTWPAGLTLSCGRNTSTGSSSMPSTATVAVVFTAEEDQIDIDITAARFSLSGSYEPGLIVQASGQAAGADSQAITTRR